jgi:hypothetical protein
MSNATEISLENLYMSISSTRKADFVSPRKRMSVHQENGSIRIAAGDVLDMPMTQHAIGQLDSSIAPGFVTYGKWLRDNNRPEVYVENVNRALAMEVKKAQIRTVTRTVAGQESSIARAILSDVFKPIDDDIVFGTAIPVIGQFSERFKTIGGNRTDTKSYLKVVTRNPVFSIQSGGRTREFSAGFIMSNSEVGMGFCEFMAFFTDSYCQNGCIFSKMVVADVKYAHRGARITTDFGQVMDDRIKRAEIESVRAVISEAAKTACSFDSYGELQSIIATSVEKKIQGQNYSALLEGVGKQFQLSQQDVEQVKAYFNPDDGNLFGVQAAVTRLAQESESYDRKIQLESVGGQILTMNDRTWNSINALSA